VADLANYTSMVFVDGENLTIRGQEFAKERGIDLIRGRWWEPNRFLWLPGTEADLIANVLQPSLQGFPNRSERAHYYTAVAADEENLAATRLAVRDLGFEPNVFKKKGGRSKGVDVTLTAELVAHAYRETYGVAYLIAGDGDYAPMVEEAKRAGRFVVVSFFERHGLSPELRIAADRFVDLSGPFVDAWLGANEDAVLDKLVDELYKTHGFVTGHREIEELTPDLDDLTRNTVLNKMWNRKTASERHELTFGTGDGDSDGDTPATT
jgi:uncharacterized LabA/DUF88 family protein